MTTAATESIDATELIELKKRLADNQLTDEDPATLAKCIDLVLQMDACLQEKNITIKKFRHMIYGSKTEKKSKRSAGAGASNKGKKGKAGEQARKNTSDQPPGKRHNRGRLGADDYPSANQINVPHPSLSPGCQCPLCSCGRLYPLTPARRIRLTGGAPIQADCFNMARLRCSSCQGVITAPEPEALSAGKHTPTACTMVCLLKYGVSLPLNRLDHLQNWLDVPLPKSTQFDMTESVVNAVHPAYEELKRQFADSHLIHTDDTWTRVLSLAEENHKNNPKRKGLYTTGAVGEKNGRRILMYITGRNHAGENLDVLLKNRTKGLPPPIHMADALACNFDHSHSTFEANCLSHGRRQFYDVESAFPDKVAYVLYKLGRVYENDAEARERNMTPEQRLAWHQRRSAPQMAQLKTWLQMLLEERCVEPNSSLGEAVIYLLRHWKRLTLFLRKTGVPLDNNICERMIKKFVALRKNSLFYKTEFGAYVGDVLLTLIHTCIEAEENPFDYLTALQTQKDALAAAPHLWLPWNFRANLDAATSMLPVAV